MTINKKINFSQIIVFNKIINDTTENKEKYFKLLQKIINSNKLNRGKFVKSELQLYKSILTDSANETENNDFNDYIKLAVFDLIAILGYDFKEIIKINFTKLSDIIGKENSNFYKDVIYLVKTKKYINLKNLSIYKNNEEFIDSFIKNMQYAEKKPFRILVTATMSAGKSTFINALAGKNICKSQNEACTGKIHSIAGKPMNDTFSAEYDYDLMLNADEFTLYDDNKKNKSDKIWVSTFFNGTLKSVPIIINDSPGVNFSLNQEHRDISRNFIKSKKYDLLIYLMNATQLLTNDDDEHLDFVKKNIGRKKIIFVVNKADMINTDEEDVDLILIKLRDALKKKGFNKPVIFPISAKAAYQAKISKIQQLSRLKTRELYTMVDNFAEENPFVKYYKNNFYNIEPETSEDEIENLIKTSGVGYLENEILKLYKENSIK